MGTIAPNPYPYFSDKVYLEGRINVFWSFASWMTLSNHIKSGEFVEGTLLYFHFGEFWKNNGLRL